jgi:hypothetical protein
MNHNKEELHDNWTKRFCNQFIIECFGHYLLWYKTKVVITHKVFTMVIELMEVYDLDIIHCQGRYYGNV